jgi:hypothetical protein
MAPYEEGLGTPMIKAQEMERPLGYSKMECKVFLDQARSHLVRSGHMAMEGTIAIIVKKELRIKTPRQIAPLLIPTPDTLGRAEQSLFLPRQPSETSSMEGRQIGAMERFRNPLITTDTSTMTVPIHSRDAMDTPIERATHQRICNLQI